MFVFRLDNTVKKSRTLSNFRQKIEGSPNIIEHPMFYKSTRHSGMEKKRTCASEPYMLNMLTVYANLVEVFQPYMQPFHCMPPVITSND